MTASGGRAGTGPASGVDSSPSGYYQVTQDGPGTYTVERRVWSCARDTPIASQDVFQAKPRTEVLASFSGSDIGPSNTNSRAEQVVQECSFSMRMADYHLV